MRKYLLILLAFVLAACSLGNIMGSQSEIEQNKQKWRDANISHYRYHLTVFNHFEL